MIQIPYTSVRYLALSFKFMKIRSTQRPALKGLTVQCGWEIVCLQHHQGSTAESKGRGEYPVVSSVSEVIPLEQQVLSCLARTHPKPPSYQPQPRHGSTRSGLLPFSSVSLLHYLLWRSKDGFESTACGRRSPPSQARLSSCVNCAHRLGNDGKCPGSWERFRHS